MSENHMRITATSSSGRSFVSLAASESDTDTKNDVIVEKRPMEVSSEENLGQLLNIPMRFAGFGALLEGLSKSGMSSSITKGCIVIPRVDIPELRIVEAQNYEVTDIYLQGMTDDGAGAVVERVSLDGLDAPRPAGTDSYTLYLKLFNPRYNDDPVIVTPEEVGLVSVKDEIMDALKFAAPGVAFWISVSVFFYSYGSITGGGGGGDTIPTLEMQPPLRAPLPTDSYGLPTF